MMTANRSTSGRNLSTGADRDRSANQAGGALLQATVDGVSPRWLNDAQIIAVADSTHGSHEFFTVRFQLLKYLVVVRGFRRLALEASCSAAEALDGFITHGLGDLRQALTGLGLLMWDVEEVVSILEWLRSFNGGRPEGDRVRLHGLDFWGTAADRERCERVIPALPAAQRPALLSALRQIAKAESNGMLRAHLAIDSATLSALEKLIAVTGARADESLENDDRLAGSAQALLALARALRSNGEDAMLPVGIPPSPVLNNHLRSLFMAARLRELVDHADDRRTVVWTHIFHAMRSPIDQPTGSPLTLGSALAAHFGSSYRVIGLETLYGTYLCRMSDDEGRLGPLTTGNIAPSPAGSFPDLLAAHDGDVSIVDLCQWARAAEPALVHAIGWLDVGPTPQHLLVVPAEAYDAVVFVETTTPTTPTAGAMAAIGAGVGY